MSRKVKSDELELWNKVAATAERLEPAKPVYPIKESKKPTPKRRDPDPIASFEVGQMRKSTIPAHDLFPGPADSLRAKPVVMDRKAYTKMSRGKLKPEGRIDLHGMTLDQAHGALNRFILGSHSKGRRLVLVITGKGKSGDEIGPIPRRRGVLKHHVPQWMQLAPLSQVILQVTPAHQRHGGDGAYYVYLKRSR